MNTWKNFEFSFITVFGWPATANYAAIKPRISFSCIADHQRPAWKFDDSVVQEKGLPVPFPSHKWSQICIDFTTENCTAPNVH